MPNLTKVFNSGQTDSPDLSGQTDTLCVILQKCLVDGYNQKSVDTLDLSNDEGVCTTTTDHNFSKDDVVIISGASPSLFNGEFRITEITSSTTFKFILIGDDQTASGSIICKYAPLGWTREFDGTNKSVYRAPTGSRRYLRINDSNANYAIAGSYKTMTDVDTGTDLLLPGSGDFYIHKSNTSNSTERKWSLIGNDRTFYLSTASYSSYLDFYQYYGFGDYKSYESNFTGSFLMCNYYAASTFNTHTIANYYSDGIYGLALTLKSSITNTNRNMRFCAVGLNGATYPGVYSPSIPVFPNFLDFSLRLSPVFTLVKNVSYYFNIIGELPGLYYPVEITNGFFLQNEKIIINNVTYVAAKIAGPTANEYGNVFFTLDDWSY